MQKVSDNFYILITLGIAGSFVLAGGAIYFFAAYLKKVARQKAELQKKEMEYQANLFTVVIQSQQEEQRRIGREIHDEAGSLLSSIRLQLSGAAVEETTTPVLTGCIAGIDKLSGIIRNISHLLNPPELELSGFHEALDSLCHSFSGQHAPQISLQDDAPGFIPRKNFQLSIALYRVMQELISNTIKHAGASSIHILIKNEGNHFIIEYSDDGIGIEPGMQKAAGLGSQNIQSRLLMIHAAHHIITAPGKGYQFIIQLDHAYII